jgi:hypothetical protein
MKKQHQRDLRSQLEVIRDHVPSDDPYEDQARFYRRTGDEAAPVDLYEDQRRFHLEMEDEAEGTAGMGHVQEAYRSTPPQD